MKNSADVVVDVAIFGGGIAGLWLLDHLQRDGFSAILLEADRLGAGQTIASQGIIHGGTKYTFGLVFDSAVKELREMPAIWRDSLQGSRGPDLSQARVLSPRTYMWVPPQIGAGVLGAFSRAVMRSRVRELPRSEWPEGLDAGAAGGSVHALDELVLDMPSVLEALRANQRDRIRKIPSGEELTLDGDGCCSVGGVTIRAERFVLACGAGNEGLLALAGIDNVPCQRRPLHQVMVAGMKQPLYVHCVGKSTKPLATVTAHPSRDGDYVWYVGGLIAEEGVAESEGALLQRAQRELPRLFPAADFGAARWATFRIDRAEGAVDGGRRPSGPVVRTQGRFIAAWPTKLALAPALSEQVVQELHRQQVRPGVELGRLGQIDALAALPEPDVARPPWEGVEAWS